MSKVIMMCGVCGSGKTAYAMQKEKEGYVRLSIDEEMWSACGQRGVDYPEEEYEALSEKAEERLRQRLVALIGDGRDAVVDFSFWNRGERAKYRALIAAAGGEAQLVYMKAGKDVLQRRLKIRNRTLNANSAFVITDEILEHHYNGFEEPTDDEHPTVIEQHD